MNHNQDAIESNQNANESSNLTNGLQILDLSRNLNLKNLIEQPNSIHLKQETHFNGKLSTPTSLSTTNLIDLNSRTNHFKELSNEFANDLKPENCINGQTNFYNTNEYRIQESKSDSEIGKENHLKDNRKFLTKDVDIFDFEHLNRHQKLSNQNLAIEATDEKSNRFKNLNNFNQQTFKLPFDSKFDNTDKLETAVIQINSDNPELFDDLKSKQNTKFNLGYQEQASIDANSLNVNNLSFQTPKQSTCQHNCSHNTSNTSSNNEEIEPLLNRSTNCNLCKNQNRLQTQSSKMEAEWHAYHNNFPEDEHFNGVIKEAERSIEEGNYPIRISQGSSGSYFVRDRNNVSFIFNFFVFYWMLILVIYFSKR